MVVLVVASVHWGPITWFAWTRNLIGYWLYLVAPYVIFGALALTGWPSLLRVATSTLIALSVVLILFLCWLWFAVPDSEVGSVTPIYLLTWAMVLVWAFAIGGRRARAGL